MIMMSVVWWSRRQNQNVVVDFEFLLINAKNASPSYQRVCPAYSSGVLVLLLL